MNKAKLKEPHSSAEIEIILFEFSDIVTASGGDVWKPGIGDLDADGWT
jgi:hypothetical protein